MSKLIYFVNLSKNLFLLNFNFRPPKSRCPKSVFENRSEKFCRVTR